MKKYLFATAGLLFTIPLFAQDNELFSAANPLLQGGVGLGTVIAVVTSWSRNKSILWAILHGILGWIYVIYFAATDEE